MIKFPDEPVTRNFKTKEKHFTDFLRDQYEPDYKFTFDRKIGGCSNRRPDAFLETAREDADGNVIQYALIIECDEFQHEHYCQTYEELRKEELVKDLGGQRVVFIRFNPDKCNGVSCFSYSKTNPPRLIKKEWTKRTAELKSKIDFYLTNAPSEKIQTEYVGFDFGK